MATSFFTARKLADLYAGSLTFSEMISATPVLFGLTAPIAASYAALHSSFAELYLLGEAPDTRTKPVIIGRNAAAVALRARAAEIAKLIEGTSTVTDQQRASLGLSVRKVPAPRPAPGEPGNFGVKLGGDGSLEVTWKCTNHGAGTMYQIFRRDTPDGDFAFVATTGQKKLVDATIPTGTTSVTYQIQAMRSTAGGPWAQFNVTFGTPAAPGPIATVSASKAASPKIAA